MKKLVIDVPEAKHAELKALAKATGKSMSKLVNDDLNTSKILRRFYDDDKLTVVDPASSKPVTLMFV